MEIVKFGLYNIYDSYFETYKDPHFSYNKNENRPHYCGVKDSSDIIWMIPLSSKVEKYRKVIQREEKKYGNNGCIYYHILEIAGVERALLIGNMFPVKEHHIKKAFTINNVPYVLKNTYHTKSIDKKVKKYLSLVVRGKIKPHIDIMKIKRSL